MALSQPTKPDESIFRRRMKVLSLPSATVAIPNDSDGDGLPDTFEEVNGLNPADPSDAAIDTDGDGLTNLEEFTLGTDINIPDTDGDGISDGNESSLNTDPLSADTDDDGLLDGEEVQAGTNPLNADVDGDGITDGNEVGLGLDPLNQDPTTTVTGQVVNGTGTPVASAVVIVFEQFTSITQANGTFTIDNVPVSLGDISVAARLVQAQVALDGTSALVSPVIGGTTDVGVIQLQSISGQVSGTIFAPSGAAVPGALVTVTSGASVRTVIASVAGVYQVDQMAPGAVTVEALDTSTGLRGRELGQLSASSTTVIDVTLGASGTLFGTVFNRDNVTPVGAGVQVELSQPDRTTLITVTNGLGEYRFDFIPLRRYTLLADDATGNLGQTQTILSATSQIVEADITFLGKGTITGTVITGNGTAVEGATVTLASLNVFRRLVGSLTTTTDALGAFSFSDVFVGLFTVSAEDPVTELAGFTESSLDFDGDSVSASITLTPSAPLTGTVFENDGITPAPNVQVTAEPSGLEVVTDGAGVYRFDALPIGSYTLNAFKPANNDQGRTTTVIEAPITPVTADITLTGIGMVNVRVEDASGNPVPEAQVILSSATSFGVSFEGATDASGNKIFETVLAGAFSVVANEATEEAGGDGWQCHSRRGDGCHDCFRASWQHHWDCPGARRSDTCPKCQSPAAALEY